MRRRRWIGAAMLVGATIGGASVAWADGGAYVDLDRTHYLPGQNARAEGYVSIPRAKQHLTDRGPFYLFVVPERVTMVEGRPIPSEAVRVATVSIERERGTTFELRSSFVVPELAGDSYGLYVCNDPCTISGFREPLTGTISIVATVREGELLTEVSRLNGRVWSLRRQVRKAERENLGLRTQLGVTEVARSELAIKVRELESNAGLAPRTTAERPLVSPLSAVIVGVGLLGLALAIVPRRRRRLELAVPDPVASPNLARNTWDRAHSSVG
jgi:hypothetical protein